MSKQLDALLDFWAKNSMNVLLEGEHGFAKTAMVGATFERNGLRWKYFSSSTMDPWVDLVGVPKEYTDEEGDTYLRLVRPKEFQKDEYDAIFFDEFNRAPKKVRNAVMELIQFKSINGKKFDNLKIVWAAINPHDEDETYDVEKLDPAQIDRFHVHYKVPSVPDKVYFVDRYGPEDGKAALEWWNGIPKEFRKHVSARRLQYIMDCYRIGGDFTYLTHPKTNPSKLLMALSSGSVLGKLADILKRGDGEELRTFLQKENNFSVAVDYMKHNTKSLSGIIPFIDEERLMRLTKEIPAVMKYVTDDANIPTYSDMLKSLVAAKTLPSDEEKRIRSILTQRVSQGIGKADTFTPVPYDTVIDPTTLTMVNLGTTVYTTIDLMAMELVRNNSQANRKSTYSYLVNNLGEPPSVDATVAVFSILFRIAESEKEETLEMEYSLIIPIMNYLLEWLSARGVSFNSEAFRKYFTTGPFAISSKVKVQGFIDLNRGLLSDPANKPRIF